MELNDQYKEEQSAVGLPSRSEDLGEVPVPSISQQGVAKTAEPEALITLLAASEQENAAWKEVLLLSVVYAAQVALMAAFPNSLIAICFYPISLFWIFFVAIRYGLRYRRTTEALAAVEDVRMVGPLVERLRGGRTERRSLRVVTQALTRLLPRLQASDASLLTKDQKARLGRYLAQLALFGRDTELQIAILYAFQQIGDNQALPVVENLTRSQPRTAAMRRVQQAAVECLPFLQERAQQEYSRETLLRPASGDTRDTNQLLRPLEETDKTDQQHLLRASLGENVQDHTGAPADQWLHPRNGQESSK